MKNMLRSLILFAIPISAALAEVNHFNYIGVSSVKIKSTVNLSGYGLDIKKSVNGTIFLSGIYQKYGDPTPNISRLILGVGIKHKINPYLIPFGQLDIIKLNDAFSTREQQRYSAGISGSITNFGYKVGLSRYDVKENEGKDQTIHLAELSYMIANNFTIAVEVENYDDADLYSFAGRYQF